MERQRRRRLADIALLHTSGHLCPESTPSDNTNQPIICTFNGPNDTPYAGLSWKITITLAPEYPFKSPSVGFVDPIFHPNVDLDSGSICLNALNSEWTPIYKLTDILETLLPQLLTYPNADDPLNTHAAHLWRNDKEAFNVQVHSTSG
jgi:ubiquitin-conjugating enzyme E2 H